MVRVLGTAGIIKPHSPTTLEVEDCLSRHDAVAEAAAIGVDDEDYGQRLRAFVVLAEGAEIDEDALKEPHEAEPRTLQGPAGDRLPRRDAPQRDREGRQAR